MIRHGNRSLVSRELVDVCRYICYANPKGSAESAQPRVYMSSCYLRLQLSSPFRQGGLNPLTVTFIPIQIVSLANYFLKHWLISDINKKTESTKSKTRLGSIEQSTTEPLSPLNSSEPPSPLMKTELIWTKHGWGQE